MNKICLIIGLLMVFFLPGNEVFAVQDSLVIYTKSDCSNCQSVKQVLRQNGIYYIEKSLEKNEIATEMLNKLSLSGYHKDIFLPVIFLNAKLYHPAIMSDSGLVSIPLQEIVDSIKYKVQKGEISLQGINTEKISNNTSNNSDCEMKVTPIYLICDNFKTEDEAKANMYKLISNGYIYAGIIQYQHQFSVFSKFYFDKISAGTDLLEMKKTFTKAYLLEMP